MSSILVNEILVLWAIVYKMVRYNSSKTFKNSVLINLMSLDFSSK